MSFQLYTIIHNVVVPTEVRMVGAILQYFFGIETSVSTTSLSLHAGGRSMSFVIAWNCVGWQSLILLGFTLVTGLQGPYTRRSKALCIVLGAEGIFLLNLLRIVLVILLAFYFGYLPAVVFHDYAGTILILIYLVLFWLFSFKYVLERQVAKEVEQSAGALEAA
jgi:exosortase/archaeosortase family protein